MFNSLNCTVVELLVWEREKKGKKRGEKKGKKRGKKKRT
jgi:hypothetical protein